MAIRELIIIPDPLLKQVSARVEKVTPEILVQLDDMVETMHDAPGIGLAGVQIGVMLRLVVIDLARDEEAPEPQYFINPEIVSTSNELLIHEEGCLSIPEYFAEVERPAACKIRFLDRDGEVQEQECEDMLARVLQHEIDHLNGVLFIDHLSRLKRELVIRKFTKLAKQSA